MKADTTAKLVRLNDAFWFRLPVAVRRFFPGLSLMLTDGVYVSAWPQVGGAAPFAVFFIGGVSGAYLLHLPSNPVLIDGSPLLLIGFLMAGLIAISTLGAALGTWLWLGYVLGDLCILRLLQRFDPVATLGTNPWADVGYLAIIYGLLAVLLIFVPFISHRFRQLALPETWAATIQAGRKRGLRLVCDALLYALFTALLLYFWTQATPILLRSASAWYNAGLSVSLISLLQKQYQPLLYVGAVCAVVRIVLEYIVSGRSGFMENVRALRGRLRDAQPKQSAARAWLGECVRIALTTLYLYGILEQRSYVIFTALVLLALAVVRKVILPRRSSWCDRVTAIPLLLRLAAVVGGAYLASYAVLPGILAQKVTSFQPLLLMLLFWVIVGTFLFPDASPRQPKGGGAR